MFISDAHVLQCILSISIVIKDMSAPVSSNILVAIPLKYVYNYGLVHLFNPFMSSEDGGLQIVIILQYL